MQLIQFLIKIPTMQNWYQKKRTKTIISTTYTVQLSTILMGLIKLRLNNFKVLIEANVTYVKKKLCKFSHLIQVNIKNKLAVMDQAFWGPSQGNLLTRESTLCRTDRLCLFDHFFPTLLNFLKNSCLNISILRIGKNYFCKKKKNFRALGALPPSRVPPAAGALPQDPQNSPPHCEFLATPMGEVAELDQNSNFLLLRILCCVLLTEEFWFNISLQTRLLSIFRIEQFHQLTPWCQRNINFCFQ